MFPQVALPKRRLHSKVSQTGQTKNSAGTERCVAGIRGRGVVLAESWDGETNLAGWWMSEKLDGARAYWTAGNSLVTGRIGCEASLQAGGPVMLRLLCLNSHRISCTLGLALVTLGLCGFVYEALSGSAGRTRSRYTNRSVAARTSRLFRTVEGCLDLHGGVRGVSICSLIIMTGLDGWRFGENLGTVPFSMSISDLKILDSSR